VLETLNTSGDTVHALSYDIDAGATLTKDTASLWQVADGGTVRMGGKGLPVVRALGNVTWYDGGTIAELRPPAAGGDTVRFEAAKKFTFTVLDSAYWNRNTYLSTSGGVQDTLGIPDDVTLNGIKAKDQVVSAGKTITSTDAGSVDLGNNSANWLFASGEQIVKIINKTIARISAYRNAMRNAYRHQ
jgi:hypothetical protein